MAAERSSRAHQATDISAAITAIHRVSYARELSSVDTVVGDGCVASVLRFEVAPAEQLVIEAGGDDAVMRLYDATELSLEASLRAAVERTTGRTRHRVPVIDEPAPRAHRRGLRPGLTQRTRSSVPVSSRMRAAGWRGPRISMRLPASLAIRCASWIARTPATSMKVRARRSSVTSSPAGSSPRSVRDELGSAREVELTRDRDKALGRQLADDDVEQRGGAVRWRGHEGLGSSRDVRRSRPGPQKPFGAHRARQGGSPARKGERTALARL